MPVPLNEKCLFNSFSSQNTQSCVGIHMCTWYLCLHTWNTQNMQMPATIQVLRWWAAITTPGMRHWRRSQCQEPSDTTEPAGVGRVQGGCVVPHRGGHSVHVSVHGIVSRRATAETPKLCSASLHLHLSMCGKQGSDCFTARMVQYDGYQGTGKQGSDCNTPSITARIFGTATGITEALSMFVTRPEWVQMHPGREHSLLELCM